MKPETIARIEAIRQKVINQTATQEELTEGIRLMREDRLGAGTATDTSRRAKAKAVVPHADDLLKELGG